MLYLERITNTPTPSNCFVIHERSTCIIIDPGTLTCTSLLDYLEQKQLEPEYVLLTHEHFDHCSGIIKLKACYKNVRVVCSSSCSKRMRSSLWNLSEYSEKIEPLSLDAADICVEDINYILKWEGHVIRFYLTRGHSEGSVCFCVDNSILFSGDSLIAGYKTVTTLKGGSKKELLLSLQMLLSHFDQTILVYPGHGDEFYLNEIVHAVKKQIIDIKMKLKI